MQKYLIPLFVLLLLGCEPSNDEYIKQREELKNEVAWERYYLEEARHSKSKLLQEVENLKVDRAVKTGTAKYILELQVYKDTLSFDDAADTVEFEIMVDKRLYDDVDTYDVLHNQMAWTKFCDQKVRVKSKRIAY